jgi:methylated-DNA-protein-cysteine methyltransferase-like protein
MRFFERVYEIVQMIPPGKVASYGQIAALLEHPRAARTVGWALHVIPDGSDIPWQRVVNSRGGTSTSTFSDPPDLQRQLLEAEGVEFDAHGCVDLRRFGWDGVPPGRR